MRIELYSIPNDIHAEAFRVFLKNNKLPFKEQDINKTAQQAISFLKITKNHSIMIINGFNELMLNQLIGHIHKYEPKIAI